MRLFMLLGLISIVPLSSALADDSDTHHVHYGDAAQAPSNSMEYWDGGGYARNLLPMNLVDNGSNRRSNYSVPRDNLEQQCRPVTPSPSDSLVPHTSPVNTSVQGDSPDSVQP